MAESFEQLTIRAETLLDEPCRTAAEIDALIETAWQLRHSQPDFAAAVSLKAKAAADQLNYLLGQARALRNVGHCYVFTDRFNDARQPLEEAHRLFAMLADDDELATVTNALGIVETAVGNHDRALENYFAALKLYKNTGNRIREAAVFNNIGGVHYRFGDYQTALDFYYQGLPLAEQTGSAWVLGCLCNSIGDVLWRVGEPRRAVEFLERAIETENLYSNPANASKAQINLGAAHQSLGNAEQALLHFTGGLEKARTAQSAETEAEALGKIGGFYRQQNDPLTAINYLEQSLTAARKVGSRFYESEALLVLAGAHGQKGDWDESIEIYHSALHLGEEIKSNETIYKAHFALFEIYQKQNDLRAALTHHQGFYEFREKVLGAEAARRIKSLLLGRDLEAAARENDLLTRKNQELDAANGELQKALADVKTLRGLLPICSYCKQIRDDQNYWQKIETYVSAHTDALFSHTYCPDCYESIVQPQLDELKERQKKNSR